MNTGDRIHRQTYNINTGDRIHSQKYDMNTGDIQLFR